MESARDWRLLSITAKRGGVGHVHKISSLILEILDVLIREHSDMVYYSIRMLLPAYDTC